MRLSANDKKLLIRFFSTRPIRKAYIFGSYARENAIKGSDIDILVELDHSNPIGMKFFTYQSGLEELLKKKVDLISNEGLSIHVKPFVERDKVLIYEQGVD